MKMIDLTGKKFERLLVIERNGSIDNKPAWKCVCDCGKTITVRGKGLRDGTTKSCGCYSKDRIAEIGRRHRKHGMFGTRIYRIWSGMNARCSNEKLPEYPRYGGRGIRVVDEWRDFEKFYAWALANGYEEDLTIDRIDNDGNYCPENCRWVDMKTQSNNKRNNVRVTCNGETHTLKEWSEIFGIKYVTLQWKVRKWGLEKAFEMLTDVK